VSRLAAVLAVTLALSAPPAFAQAGSEPAHTVRSGTIEVRLPAPIAAAQKPAKDGGDDDGGGVPIWAGIGLMLLAAGAGTIAARARNRRRMRNWSGE
jgi:hypothetical protein